MAIGASATWTGWFGATARTVEDCSSWATFAFFAPVEVTVNAVTWWGAPSWGATTAAYVTGDCAVGVTAASQVAGGGGGGGGGGWQRRGDATERDDARQHHARAGS